MKVFSYTCPIEKVGEVRTTLIGLGANIFKQVQITDAESIPTVSLAKLIFMVNKETELLLKLKFPPGTFTDCTL